LVVNEGSVGVAVRHDDLGVRLHGHVNEGHPFAICRFKFK
jgi:hypothetical protein